MNEDMHIYYDEEGDFLEIEFGTYTRSFCRDAGKGVFQRFDQKTGEFKGVGILGLRKRTKGCKTLEIKLPLEIVHE